MGQERKGEPEMSDERLLRVKPPERAITIEREVPFHDLDPLQVVWHGNYYKYFEMGRQALQRAHRIDVGDLIELGFHWYVIETRARHIAPLRYGDRFRVSSWFGSTDPKIAIAYEIVSVATNRRVARGVTVMVTTTPTGEMLLETPREILDRIGS